MLQSLQQAASTFAGMVTAFCHKMGWLNLELLIGQFQNRLQFGVQRELVDLCRLNALNGQRARTLYNAKIDTVAVLANTSPAEVENVLWSAMPFESRKRGWINNTMKSTNSTSPALIKVMVRRNERPSVGHTYGPSG